MGNYLLFSSNDTFTSFDGIKGNLRRNTCLPSIIFDDKKQLHMNLVSLHNPSVGFRSEMHMMDAMGMHMMDASLETRFKWEHELALFTFYRYS